MATSNEPKMRQRSQQTSAGSANANRMITFGGGRLLSPWALMRRMTAELDRLAATDGRDQPAVASGAEASSQSQGTDDAGLMRVDWVPRIEVAKRDGNLVVRAELAGIKPDDVNITVDDGLLTISGERKQEQHEERDGIVRTERAYGTFFRALPLPDGVDEEHIAAKFRDGVLELTIPVAERERGRRIPVES